MKLKRFNACVIFALLAMGSSHVMAQGVGLIDGDEPQNDRRVEVRTQTVMMNRSGQGSKSEAITFPEKTGFFTNSMGGMHFVSSEIPVKNAPYSAEAITEVVQKLPDGNSISNKTSMLSFRDSQGNTRTEMRNAKGDTTQIVIAEVNGAVTTLNPNTKTATKIGRASCRERV